MFGCIHVIIRRHASKLNTRSQRETYITDGKHASLGICVRGNTHPWETHITVTPGQGPCNFTYMSELPYQHGY